MVCIKSRFAGAKTQRFSGDGIVRALLATLVFVLAFISSTSPGRDAYGAGLEDFEKEIKKFNDDAVLVRNMGDFEKLAIIQEDRDSVIAKQVLDDADADNVWIKAASALVRVDGNLNNVEFGKQKPGLVDQCNYKEAIKILEELWKSLDKDDGVVLPGHVATRIFEIVNQAEGIHQGAMDEKSPYFLIEKEKVRQYLQEAADHDPCCILAIPMLNMLKEGNPAEVFLRAEVRRDFKKRQAELADLSHPAALVGGKQGGGTTGDADVAVTEWHGPVELCKADSLRQLLQDLDYVQPLAGGITFSNRGSVIPKNITIMKDASSSSVASLYGFLLAHNARDAKGNMRTAVSLVESKRGVEKLQWESHYLEVLWKKAVASDDGANAEELLTPEAKLLSRFPELFDFQLEGEEYAVLRVPVSQIKELVKVDPPRLMIKDLYKFKTDIEKPVKFAFADTNFWKKHQELSYKQRKTDFKPSKALLGKIESIQARKDRTRHPVEELLEYDNPILLLSSYDGGNRLEGEGGIRKSGTQPNWLIDEDDQKYLKMEDGSKLIFYENAELGNASFSLAKGETITNMPLTLTSVDLAVFEATPFGQVVAFLLKKAGYTGEEKSKEMKKVIDAYMTRKVYWPPRYKTFARAKGRIRGEIIDGHEIVCREAMSSIFNWTESSSIFMNYYQPPADLQRKEKTCLSDLQSFQEMFSAYGFRSLRDPRNRLVTNRDLTYMTYVTQQTINDLKSGKTAQYPFDIWSSDGTKRVGLDQIYSWQDYLEIKDNVYYEHLSKMLMLHPSPGALAMIKRDARKIIDNPIEGENLGKTKEEENQQKDNSEATQKRRPAALVTLTNYVETDFAANAGELAKGFDQALNKLSTSYAGFYKKIIDGAYERERKAGIVSIQLARVNEAKNQERMWKMQDNQGSWQKEQGQAWEQQKEREIQQLGRDLGKFNAEVGEAGAAQQSLLGILHRTARQLHKDKYHHRSVIFYNDILDVDKLFDAGVLELPGARGRLRNTVGPFRFFLSVATTDKAQDFINEVTELIKSQLYQIQIQLELAKALAETQFKDSAVFLIDHVEHAYEWNLAPAIKLSEEYVETYGLTFSKEMIKALKDIEGLVAAAGVLRAKVNLKVDWKNVEGPRGGGGGFQALLAEIGTNLKKDVPDTSISQKLLEVLAGDRLPLEDWLAAKNTLKADEELFTTGDFAISPLAFCPFRYDQENGFVQDPVATFKGVSTEQVLAYCNGKQLNNPEEECACNFLLAWYWMDSNQPESAKARSAFMEAARLYREMFAQKQDESIGSFVAEFQSLIMFLGASSMVENLPGISKQQTEFSEGLMAQVYDWQKRWFAKGYSPSHARFMRTEAELALSNLLNWKAQQNDKYQRDRYYFPDYRFWENSFVPDLVVAEMIERRARELQEFAANAKEKAAGQEGAGAEQESPPLVWFEDGDVESFWATFRVPRDLDFIKE